MRSAVGYKPPHLKFPVHSQCFLGFAGHAIPLALRRILRCMLPVYSFIPRVFARVHRAFAGRPLVQFQVRFPHCVFPYYKVVPL